MYQNTCIQKVTDDIGMYKKTPKCSH